MDTHLLETFLDLEQTRHFGQTAENLHITQAAVSMRIKQLEALLDGDLLVRDRHNLQLTDAGQRLIPYAQTMVNTWTQARQSLISGSPDNQQISLGSTPNLWRYQFQTALGQIRRERPDLEIHAQGLSSGRCLSELLDGTLDLILLSERIVDSRLKSMRLGQFRLMLMSHDDETMPLSMAQTTMILMDWGKAFTQFFERRFARVTPLAQTNLTSLAISMMSEHRHCCYLPESMIDDSDSAGLKVIASAPIFKRNLYAIWRADHRQLKHVRQIAECFRTEALADSTDDHSSQSS